MLVLTSLVIKFIQISDKEKSVVCFNIFESKRIIPVNFFSTNSRQDGGITCVYILKLCLLKKAVRCVIKTTVTSALLQVF